MYPLFFCLLSFTMQTMKWSRNVNMKQPDLGNLREMGFYIK